MKKNIITTTFLLLSAFGFSQEITGSWTGELEFQGQKLPLIFNIKAEGNAWITTMDSPKQGGKDIPTKKTTFENKNLVIDASNFGISYTGILENQTIKGVFKQGSMELPLILEKSNSDKKFALNRPQTPKGPFAYSQEEVTVLNPKDKNTLAGTLIPTDKNKPIVVMITGSGPSDRNESLFGHEPFAVIADFLAQNKIGSLRMDDRGVGKSSPVTQIPTSADFVTDITAAVDFLAKRGYTNIGLLGYSEGGMIAPMVALQNKNVKFIVSLAGPGVPIIDLMCKQKTQASLLAGENPEKTAKDVAIVRKMYQLTIDYKGTQLGNDLGKLYEDEMKNYPTTYGLTDAKKKEIGNDYVQFITNPWFLYLIKWNPKEYWGKIKVPVLALNGSLDFQVDATSNLKGIRKNLTQAKNKRFEVVLMDGMNHLFQECKTGAIDEYGEIEQTISPKVLSKVKDWILKL